MHLAKYVSCEYTTIVGAYSSAKKAKEAYNKIIEEYRQLPTFKEGREEMENCYRIETKSNTHHFYIKVKELQ